MAAKNAKPANSSNSEIEWTFIDSYDGTIETKKDCVTYRKPTYSEILKGVTEDELAEVESEPEFEVLASFQFRSKGESFGIGSSAHRNPKSSAKTEAKDDKSDGGSSDEGIMIISGHYESEKPVFNEKNRNDIDIIDSDECDANDELTTPTTKAKCKSDGSGTDDAIVVVEEGCMYDDDDDEMIDLGDSIFSGKSRRTGDDDDDNENDDNDDVSKSSNDTEAFMDTSLNKIFFDDETDEPTEVEPQSTPFMDTSLNKIFFDDETDEPTEIKPQNSPFMDTSLNRILIDDEDEPAEETVKSNVKPVSVTSDTKRFLSIDPLDPSRDLAWDSLTFDLMNVQPILMVSTTSLNDSSDSVLFQDSDESDCDLSSDNSFVPISKSDTHDESSSSFDNLSDLSDYYCDFDETPMIPEWFHDPNFKIIGLNDSHDDNSCKDIEEEDICDPLIPAWLHDPDHNIYDFDESFDECDYSDYSDSDSEFTDDSDSDDDSVVAIPDWLFGSKDKRHHKDDEESFLFSQLFVDVPTFVILLFLTTALGFSIGHGLTVYLSGQARNIKLDGVPTQANSYPSYPEQRILTAAEIAKVDLLKLEDEIYRQKESELLSSHLRYDLKNVHQKLQDKHNSLLRNYKSTEGRLHITKSMSWFWRSKYDQEKLRSENSSAVIYLQRQLERVGALYEKEKKVANRWRRLRKSRFPLSRRQNDSREQTWNDSLNGKVSDSKASLASKYWVQAILSSRGIDWEGFRKRWTEDFKKLKEGSCVLNKSFISQNLFGLRRNNKLCKKSGLQNVTIKRNSSILSKLDEKRSKVTKENERNVQTRVHSPKTLVPEGPPKLVEREKLMFGLIEIKNEQRKGETARRRRENLRKVRLQKREARLKALKVQHQVNELKNVLAELRSERRKAEKEKFQLEESWRKLKRQRNQFENEKLTKKRSEKKKIKKIKSKLKKARTKLMTWKNVAFLFQKKAATLQRDIQQISRAKEISRSKDIKKIKRDLKIEKRKLKKQRHELKDLKTRLRKEHRNYAREGWKLERKRKQLEKIQAPPNYTGKSSKKCPRQTKSKRKEKRLGVRKTRKKFQTSSKGKKNRRNKKERSKQGPKTYWENLEKTLKEWTENLNKTVKEKAGGKIKKIWKNLQDRFGTLMDFGWTKRKAKPPYQPKKGKKNKEEDSKSGASLVYQKVLDEQLKFEKQKRKELNDSRKPMKSKSSLIHKKKNKEQRKKDSDEGLKQRRRRQRRKYQRELERLQQWALQMNEKKLEHERIYKDKGKTKTKCKKVRLKSKSDEKEKDESDEKSRSRRELDSDSVEDGNNLTNTLMLLVQPQFSEYQYNSPEKLYFDSKEPLQNTERIVHDVTMAQLELENKRQSSTELSIPIDDESVLRSTMSAHPEHQSPYQGNEEQMSNKPTPPLPDSTLYNKLPFLGVLESEKGGSMGLLIPPPSLDPMSSHVSVEDQSDLGTKAWYMRKTPQAWIPPPGPLQSDGSWFFQRSADRAEHKHNSFKTEKFEKKDDIWVFERASDRAKQRLRHGPQNKENENEQNSFKTEFLNIDEKLVKKNGIWVFARASNRAEQRLLYEPLNKQSAEDKPGSHSKKTYFSRRPKEKNKDGTWVFERANDRAEQRSNHDPWYMRRAEGRENDRQQEQDSWFIERGSDRELLREEDEHDGDYDDNDDDYHYDIDFGNYDDVDDDISAP